MFKTFDSEITDFKAGAEELCLNICCWLTLCVLLP